MQDLFGSVRRSLVFRPTSDNNNATQENSTPVAITTNAFVEKINSCIRKSRVFSKPSSPSPSPLIRWRKGELIGSGAFGRVYMGMNLDSGELLAVKEVLIAVNSASKEKTQAHIRELEEEVKLLKNLSHPNIVRYLGTVREEETLNILLEFVPGGSISSLLGKFGPFPEAVIRKYTKQLLLGLEYLHNNGIMHRDIKGANILVDNKGNIKLADFGASKQVVELATITGAKSMKGTPYWMAPEVILQTGHSFSADIWSVGCTVIEMATGKPPWSQQYQEVAALFYVGTTKSHPPIPEHLSSEAKDFLLKCLQKEPELRQVASELLKHPFVTGESQEPSPVLHASIMNNSEIPSPFTNHEDLQVPRCRDSADICNLGSLNCSNTFVEKFSKSKDWRINCSDDDMCLIDKDDSMVSNVRLCSASMLDNVNQISDPSREDPEMVPVGFPITSGEEGNNSSYTGGPSFSEDDNELTESKIRVFLDEKALELKKLQTPLYEEFYNSLNLSCSPSFVEKRDETPPNYLKLPPKSRSPSRGPVVTPSSAADAISTGSPGSNNSRRVSNSGTASEQTPQDNSSPQHGDWKGLLVDGQPEPSRPSLILSERQRKWKEELDQELERKREMLRQAGLGGKTSSPKDRALNRQRDRTRFASPGK
ncbi:Mitogen-activated protein kinase kinase kinase NPK1 [Hibiscus syriacus]|uniref:mitogen-activated protein kinase kinase kinase n=1 Tax=Hibiscus syriacus TaxID=106335 RepID=A0A6A2YYX7_HIBSY|nr:mitogen-activated protein kinase kinase kinase ANP1-like [Hibiscus syriacus]KAE8684112.1 Mitogen-activated protein kinase kinase kinase NPK1 [Hibiscus syriacus]